MAKEFLDPTIFTDPLGALGLLAKSIKKASDYDRNKDKNVFEAVVISPPATDLYVDGSTRTKVYVRLDTQTGHENIPPGHAFLQNPCDLTTNQNPQQAQKALALVKMHTAVYIPEVEEDSGVDPVTLNDRILVRLNPNVFGYDMSEGEYVGAIKKKKKFIAKPEAADEGCKSLAKVFEGNLANAQPLDAAQTSTDLEALNPDFKGLVDQLIANMQSRGYSTRIVTTYRSLSAQTAAVTAKTSQTSFGYHNFVTEDGNPASQAVDLVSAEITVGGGYGPDNPEDDPVAHASAAEYFKVLGEEATNLNLRWGGNFPHSNPIWAKHGMGWDPAHVELQGSPGETLASATQNARDAGYTV